MEKTNKNVVMCGPTHMIGKTRSTERMNEKTAFQVFLEDLRLEQMEQH
jgi:hypothetical protein